MIDKECKTGQIPQINKKGFSGNTLSNFQDRISNARPHGLGPQINKNGLPWYAKKRVGNARQGR
jgi:hypothetical protein